MKRIFTLFALVALSAGLFAQDCTNLIISEYDEGSGNNKALELYNTSDQIIDLGNYWIVRYSNGAFTFDAGGYTRLEGFIQPHTTFVFVNGQTTDQDLGGGSISPKCDPALQALGNQLDHAYPAPTYMNGNDAIALLYDTETGTKPSGSSQLVDLFGAIGGGMSADDEGWASFTDTWVYKNIYDANGNITGTDSTYITKYIVPSGYYWLPWTANHSLVRKHSVKKGITANPSVFNVTVEWDTIPGGADQWDSLGNHTCDCANQTDVIINLTSPKAYVFPNPSTDGRFTISTNTPVKEFEVVNMLGQTVIREDNRRGDLSLKVNLTEGKSGLYFIRMTFDNNKVITKKLLVR